MRELKFRAWNSRTEVMQYTNEDQTVWVGGAQPSVNTTITGSIGAQISGDFIPMQWTGLKDKNGVDIYEGDFFQRPVKINKSLHGEWTIYQFMIKNGNTIISYLRSEKDTGIPEGYMAALYTDELDIDMKTLMFAKEVTLYEVGILGNIHEHKHLLK